jgi:Rod binding domain-containing protein
MMDSSLSTAMTRMNASASDLSLDSARAARKTPNLKQAGKAFEGLMMQEMMKAMHESKLADGLFESEAEKPFQSMLDQSYANLAGKNFNLGIADAITRQFTPHVSKGGQ